MRGKLTLNNLLIVLGAIFSVRPYYIQYNDTANNIWKYTAMILAIIMLVRLVFQNYIKDGGLLIISKETTIFYLFTIWCVLYIVETLFRGSDELMSLFSNIAQSMLAFSSFALAAKGRDQYERLNLIKNIYAVYILIDAFTVFFDISSLLGLRSTITSFLGYNDNYASFEILVMLGIIFEITYVIKGKITVFAVFVYICAFGAKIYSLSFTALFGFTFFGILCLLRKRINIKSTTKIIAAEIVLCLFVILMASYTNWYLYLGNLLAMVGKGGFGYREYIWPKSINAILRSPIFGYGELDSSKTFQSVVGLSVWDTQANHCHNLLLQILFNTGCIGLILIVLVMKKAVNLYLTTEMCPGYLMFGFIAYLGIAIMDGYIFTYVFWGLIGFMTYYKEIISTLASEQEGGIREMRVLNRKGLEAQI